MQMVVTTIAIPLRLKAKKGEEEKLNFFPILCTLYMQTLDWVDRNFTSGYVCFILGLWYIALPVLLRALDLWLLTMVSNFFKGKPQEFHLFTMSIRKQDQLFLGLIIKNWVIANSISSGIFVCDLSELIFILIFSLICTLAKS